MAQFIYIDETGSEPSVERLIIAAVLVPEDRVQILALRMRQLAFHHLGWLPAIFEFHGVEIWNKQGHWANKSYEQLIDVYKAVIGLLDELDLEVSHATINRFKLVARRGAGAEESAYRLALQFLLEKLDRYGAPLQVVIADEAKQQQVSAVAMVADMQDWGGGEVPGRQLRSIIDTLHFVDSRKNHGVQLADMVAYVLQRYYRGETHPEAQAALIDLRTTIDRHVLTCREEWPRSS